MRQRGLLRPIVLIVLIVLALVAGYLVVRNGAVQAASRQPASALLAAQLAPENPEILTLQAKALLHPTNNPNLRYMTAGPQPPNAADLLVGNRLQNVIKKLLDSGVDHVIIDSPPVLGLADAPLIAASVEGTIYAVEARAIRTSRVRTAMARLRGANINLLGVVLTKFSTKHTQYSYAYDYKYGYGKSTAQG